MIKSFLLLLLIVLPDASSAAVSLTFVEGQVDQLECRPLMRAPRNFKGLLVLEVKNRGKTWAEPVRFELVLRTKPKFEGVPTRIVHDRVGRPVYGRAGRAIRPGGKQPYFFPAPWSNDPKARYDVRVLEASFFAGTGIEKPPVKVGRARKDEIFDEFLGHDVAITKVDLINQLDLPVEVILQAEPDSSGNGRLFMERLAAGQTRTVGGNSLEGSYEGRPASVRMVEGTFKSLRVLDWSVHHDSGNELANNLLRDAWEKWYRWDGAGLAVTGRVEYEMDARVEGLPSGRSRGHATFRIAAGDRVVVDIEGSSNLDLTYQLGRVIALAFEDLRRPGFDDLVEDFTPEMDRLGETSRILLAAHEGSPFLDYPFHEIREGAVVGGGGREGGVRKVLERQNRMADEQRYLAEQVIVREHAHGKVNLSERWTFQYGEADGRVVPAVIEHRQNHMLSENLRVWTKLSFANLKVAGAVPARSVPVGTAADALREAWESPYRYPAEPVLLEGGFVAETPSRPLEWREREETSGQFVFHGYTGRRRSSSAAVFERAELDIDDVRSDDARQALVNIVQARYSIWTRQDFAGRRSFDDLFTGATIRQSSEKPNVFDIEGNHIIRITVANGLVESMVFADGSTRRFRFRSVDGETLATRVSNDHGDHQSSFEVTYRKTKAGRHYPAVIEMKNWFGPDWGPEKYRFNAR